jgi:hypothetical protein
MSGVSEKQLTRESQRLEKGGVEFCTVIENMISDITIHELRDVIEIWNLLPEEQWARYAAMELEDLREQLLLKEALKRLRSKYKEIRNYGHKKKNRNQGDEEVVE